MLSRWKVVLGAVVVVLGLGAAGVVAVPRVFGDDPVVPVWEVDGGVGFGSVSWSPDGSVLAADDSGKDQVMFWDPVSGEVVETFDVETGAGLNGVVWSPDGGLVAVRGDGNEVGLLDVESGEFVQSFVGHTNNVLVAAWSPDGAMLATGSGDSTVRLWDVATGEMVNIFEGHTGDVTSVAWSPDGTRVASGARKGFPDESPSFRMWDVATGERINTSESDTESVRFGGWSPDGSMLVSSSSSHVDLRDPATGDITQTLSVEGVSVGLSVAWSPDSSRLATGGGDGVIRLWDPASGELIQSFEADSKGVVSVEWSPDGTRLVTSNRDGTVRLWDINELFPTP